MSYLNCVFCEEEVTTPPGLNDSTAKAICELFVARCGRLPRMDGKRDAYLDGDEKGSCATASVTVFVMGLIALRAHYRSGDTSRVITS